jgi:hypothetical protein
MTIYDIIFSALRKIKFLRMVASILADVPDYDPTESRPLTEEEQAWLNEYISENV